MDIKQTNILATDTCFRNGWCKSVSIQAMSPDPKAHKLATISTCMMAGAFQINWKHLKPYACPPFPIIRRVLAKPRWYTQLLRMSIQDPILIPPFPNLFTDPNQNQPPSRQNQKSALAKWKVFGSSILQKSHQTKSGVAYFFQDKLISFLQVKSFC